MLWPPFLTPKDDIYLLPLAGFSPHSAGIFALNQNIYNLASGKVNFIGYQDGTNDRFYYQCKYDRDNRLIRALTRTKAGILPQGSELLNENKYYLPVLPAQDRASTLRQSGPAP